MSPSEDTSLIYEGEAPSLQRGFAVVRDALRDMPNRPGCYVMRDDDGAVLYVGKAAALAKRVRNYANSTNLPNRIVRMIAETATLTTTVTDSEAEALLLENNLIKSERPKFNILFRDDKSFPYIELSRGHKWPMLTKHRGEKNPDNVYYGPFASAGAVENTIVSLQKAFQLRSCSEHIFRSRTRPCLLHQIKRCSAPCVGMISEADYADTVEAARQFLAGASNEVRQAWTARMQNAAENMEFEQAAIYRDRLRALGHVQARQGVNVPEMADSDLFALARQGDRVCVLVWFFRAGQNQGGKPYFQTCDASIPDAEVMDSFLAQDCGAVGDAIRPRYVAGGIERPRRPPYRITDPAARPAPPRRRTGGGKRPARPEAAHEPAGRPRAGLGGHRKIAESGGAAGTGGDLRQQPFDGHPPNGRHGRLYAGGLAA